MGTNALTYLQKADPVFKRIIKQVGPPNIPHETDYFYTLVDAIASQQLSGKASEAILTRLKALYPKHTYPIPEDILGTNELVLREVGFSRPKILYLKDLAKNFLEGTINTEEFAGLDDEEIIKRLTFVKGIGRWTAEIFLMYSLGREDVLPADDLGLQRAVKLVYGLDSWPKPKVVQEIAVSWRPYRTLATWYMWQSLNFRPIAK